GCRDFAEHSAAFELLQASGGVHRDPRRLIADGSQQRFRLSIAGEAAKRGDGAYPHLFVGVVAAGPQQGYMLLAPDAAQKVEGRAKQLRGRIVLDEGNSQVRGFEV